ncbi:hypothetical protein EKO04_005134 [Ascochyta lentis]|uniref:GST C-terminal domain-containing protein n=1 Tax=Ascochyta lentis TaxID=205686 RepID=A0A8H7J5K3_9PLEO|nr:hypothetical protein EKO04_005134 [Ascochyta lentis]
MAFGTVFTFPGDHCRTIGIKAAAKVNNIELVFDVQPRTPEHFAVSKLGKVPAFIGTDGFKLYECTAIAIYIASQDKSTSLLGADDREYATIIQYMSFFNSEIVLPLVERYLPLAGIRPYDATAVATFEKMSEAAVAVIEADLEGKTFLVGESVTLADYFCAGVISLGFEFFYGKEWRKSHPNVVRWYAGVVELESYKAVIEKMEWIEEPKFAGKATEQEK